MIDRGAKPTLHKDMPELARDYEMVMIDGAPRVNELGRSAIMAWRAPWRSSTYLFCRSRCINASAARGLAVFEAAPNSDGRGRSPYLRFYDSPQIRL